MLMFEPKQLEQFAHACFAERMAGLVSKLHVGQAQPVDESALKTEILRQLERAKEYGFEAERDCACWVLAAWCLGADFDRKIPAIAQVLARRDVGPEYKTLALELMMRAFFVGLAGQSRIAL